MIFPTSPSIETHFYLKIMSIFRHFNQYSVQISLYEIQQQGTNENHWKPFCSLNNFSQFYFHEFIETSKNRERKNDGHIFKTNAHTMATCVVLISSFKVTNFHINNGAHFVPTQNGNAAVSVYLHRELMCVFNQEVCLALLCLIVDKLQTEQSSPRASTG